MNEMEIDEEAKKWGIGTDHSWIQVTIDMKMITERRREPYKKQSKITDKTDWGNYEKALGDRLEGWDACHDCIQEDSQSEVSNWGPGT